MRLIFARKHAIGSYIIRLFTFSSWSHVGLVFSDEMVIDATFAKGVRLIPLTEFMSEYTDIDVWFVKTPDEASARKFAELQLGKKYDLSAIFGLIFQRNWQQDDKWFCSELVEAVLKAGGLVRFRDSPHRITPQQSWAAY